jgi:hypothetical protein
MSKKSIPIPEVKIENTREKETIETVEKETKETVKIINIPFIFDMEIEVRLNQGNVPYFTPNNHKYNENTGEAVFEKTFGIFYIQSNYTIADAVKLAVCACLHYKNHSRNINFTDHDFVNAVSSLTEKIMKIGA